VSCPKRQLMRDLVKVNEERQREIIAKLEKERPEKEKLAHEKMSKSTAKGTAKSIDDIDDPGRHKMDRLQVKRKKKEERQRELLGKQQMPASHEALRISKLWSFKIYPQGFKPKSELVKAYTQASTSIFAWTPNIRILPPFRICRTSRYLHLS